MKPKINLNRWLGMRYRKIARAGTLVVILAILAVFSSYMFSTETVGIDTQSTLDAVNTQAAIFIEQTQQVMSFTPTIPATETLISRPIKSETPNPTHTLLAAFAEVDEQFLDALQANVAFNRPSLMKQDEVVDIEFILNPSQSEQELATQIVQRRELATSTAEPDVLIAPGGQAVTVDTSQVEITPLMRAVLISVDPDAFIITESHASAEQAISTAETTVWRWSILAKKKGTQRLELVLYRLVKYEGKDYWHEVETYKAEIDVEVTPLQELQTWDWRWIASAILIPLVVALWGWWRSRNKKSEPVEGERPRGRVKRNRN